MEKKDFIGNKEAILKEAQRLLSEESLTMENLSEATRISRATLYRHFGGRGAIIEELPLQFQRYLRNPKEIKTKILESARTLFGSKGFYRTTIEEIAQNASVGAATVYRHFETKEGLIQAFRDHYKPQSILSALKHQMDQTIEQQITQIVKEGLEFIVKNRDLFAMSFLENETAMGYYRDSLDKTNRTIPQISEYFKNLQKGGQIKGEDPQLLAFSLMGLIMAHGFIQKGYTGKNPEDLQERAQFITRLFLRGIEV